MMNKYSLFLKACMLSIASIFSLATVAQQWEQIQQLPAAQSIFVASNGNLISSDFQFDYTGGIYYSTDKGDTWTKVDVQDYAYNKMIQAGEYIIASGEGCNLARSKDNGITWEILNYGYMFTDFLGEEAIEYDLAYAITYFKDKLFVADFGGGGVIYSEDFGETWTLTDRETLKYDLGNIKSTAKGDGTGIDSFYNLAENNGELLLFGVYFIYRLNETDYTWELIRSDSNFMGVSCTVDQTLFCGRAVMNYDSAVPFLESTTDAGRTWSHIAHADTTYDTNIRALHSDEKGIYAGMQCGNIYYSRDLGQTWDSIFNGLSAGFPPLIITSDNDYIYAAIYDVPWSTNTTSGIYRYNKSELPVASISITDSDDFKVYACNNTLHISQQANIVIYNTTGAIVFANEECETVDISALPQGVYLYVVTDGYSYTTGKFIK